MIMGGRRSGEAEQQAERPRQASKPYQPHMPALARVLINSRMFQRLMERLDTREGVEPDNAPAFREPAPSRASERLLPEKGTFVPRMHPLGGMVFRTRFVQRLLGNPMDRTAPIICGDSPASGEGNADDSTKDRSRNKDNGSRKDNTRSTSKIERPLTDTELRELRQKALISSLLRFATRWGGR